LNWIFYAKVQSDVMYLLKMKNSLAIFLFLLGHFVFYTPKAQANSAIDASTIASAKLDSLTVLLESSPEDQDRTATIYNNLGTQYKLQGRYNLALACYSNALEIDRERGDSLSVARNIIGIGVVCDHQARYADALDYFFKALKLYEDAAKKGEQEGSIGIAKAHGNIGVNYNYQQRYDLAIEHFTKSLEIKRQFDLQDGMAISYSNLAGSYFGLGSYSKAREYYEKSMEIAVKLGNQRGISINFIKLGEVCTRESEYDEAMKYYLSALEIQEKTGDRKMMSNSLNGMADLLIRQGETEKAIRYLEKGLSIAKELGAKKEIKDGFYGLSEAYIQKGDYQNAYKYHSQYAELKDSIFTEESAQKLAEMQALFDSEKRERKIETLTKDQRLKDAEIEFRNAVIIGIILILGLVFLVYNRYKAKQKIAMDKQMADIRQKSLIGLMNPHFTFNSLQSIQNVVIKKDVVATNSFISKFADLMRMTLEYSQKDTIPLSEELLFLGHYIDLEVLRFEGKFKYNLNLDPSIDGDLVRIPPMLIQPFVENAINHGILHKSSSGKIDISITKVNASILCTVEDDGIGRKKAEELGNEKQKKHRSFGIKLTEERLKLLRLGGRAKIGFEITDLIDENKVARGTKVEITIPVELI